MLSKVLSIFLSIFFYFTCIALGSDYHERLLLRPLPQSALLASFNFRSNTSATSFEQQHFRYFPRSLGQILQHAGTKELHLRFSLGRWDAENWGARPWDGAREGGTGVELWAWVEAESNEEANSRWLTLTNALSGLFCASLNFIDATKTIRPVMTFQPEGHHPNSTTDNLHLLHGTLPHEVVCTENLTPFLKLLPCKGKAGISSLLDGHKLFDASWQSMAIDVRPLCEVDGSGCILEIEQTVDMVLDIDRSKRPRDNPIPRPIKPTDLECDASKPYHAHDSCYPLDKKAEVAWNLKDVFGRPIKGSCPITADRGPDSETVCINVAPEREVQIQTSGGWTESKSEDGFVRCYRIFGDSDFDLNFPSQLVDKTVPLAQPRLYAARSINGYGQERGSVQAVITNPSPVDTIDLIYLESLPWFMKPYIHTLKAAILPSTNSTPTPPIKETYYRPSLDRHRGTHLELLLTVPPVSKVILTYDFEKAILRYTEYPPDANRGFDVAPAVIRLLSPRAPRFPHSTPEALKRGTYLRTTSLLLPLPTPDFSMPYNVIILTSTVMALGFGSIFNPLVRRFVGVEEVGAAGLAGAVRLRGFLRGRVERLRARFGGKGGKGE
ncbi:GPI transamidase-like protein component Gpi16 [Patellaria atrata CBS 101060]|uniref:GPI transamidase-like protein component Gpi16 n=1 Tax=Patellaria atrata CBS 101060 TaxID=1346257 RepID=A0A9P4S7S0_9PEZI|nr:GPI transamidase-like protein component Gpi16 [Patellaria atrata CBS 101060]